jgi:hypothetical protein
VDLRDNFGQRAADLEASGLIEQLQATLDQAAMQADANASDNAQRQLPNSSGSRLLAFEGDGFIRATRICNGWETKPEADREKNGFIELTLGFTEKGFDPVVWGTLRECLYLAPSGQVRLTAADSARSALNVHLGAAANAETIATQPLLFDINVNGTVAGQTTRLKFDFRVLPESGNIEFAVPVADEFVIVITHLGLPVGLRAKNGQFTCDLDFNCTLAAADAGAAP